MQAFRWRDVDLVENVLRVGDSKSEDGIRAIALAPTLAEELWQQRRGSNLKGDDELVFCDQERGTTYREETFTPLFPAALTAAGVDGHGRPFHDYADLWVMPTCGWVAFDGAGSGAARSA